MISRLTGPLATSSPSGVHVTLHSSLKCQLRLTGWARLPLISSRTTSASPSLSSSQLRRWIGLPGRRR